APAPRKPSNNHLQVAGYRTLGSLPEKASRKGGFLFLTKDATGCQVQALQKHGKEADDQLVQDRLLQLHICSVGKLVMHPLNPPISLRGVIPLFVHTIREGAVAVVPIADHQRFEVAGKTPAKRSAGPRLR